MRKVKALLIAATMLFGTAASVNTLAGGYHHHGHARVGVFIGAPLFYSPWYYPYGYYPAPYYYPPVAYPSYSSGPTTYVEQGQPEAAPAQRSDSNTNSNYWYYCPEAKAYYPYVKQCAAGWQKVSPQPPS